MNDSEKYSTSLRKLQTSIDKILFCYQANVSNPAKQVMDSHKLYDNAAQDLRTGLSFFEEYLQNISHSIKSDLETKIGNLRE